MRASHRRLLVLNVRLYFEDTVRRSPLAGQGAEPAGRAPPRRPTLLLSRLIGLPRAQGGSTGRKHAPSRHAPCRQAAGHAAQGRWRRHRRGLCRAELGDVRLGLPKRARPARLALGIATLTLPASLSRGAEESSGRSGGEQHALGAEEAAAREERTIGVPEVEQQLGSAEHEPCGNMWERLGGSASGIAGRTSARARERAELGNADANGKEWCEVGSGAAVKTGGDDGNKRRHDVHNRVHRAVTRCEAGGDAGDENGRQEAAARPASNARGGGSPVRLGSSTNTSATTRLHANHTAEQPSVASVRGSGMNATDFVRTTSPITASGAAYIAVLSTAHVTPITALERPRGWPVLLGHGSKCSSGATAVPKSRRTRKRTKARALFVTSSPCRSRAKSRKISTYPTSSTLPITFVARICPLHGVMLGLSIREPHPALDGGGDVGDDGEIVDFLIAQYLIHHAQRREKEEDREDRPGPPQHHIGSCPRRVRARQDRLERRSTRHGTSRSPQQLARGMLCRRRRRCHPARRVITGGRRASEKKRARLRPKEELLECQRPLERRAASLRRRRPPRPREQHAQQGRARGARAHRAIARTSAASVRRRDGPRWDEDQIWSSLLI